MSWIDYVNTLVDGTVCTDCAIYALAAPHGVWAAYPGGGFASLTSQELACLVSKDRSPLFINGLVLGGQKCSVLRDLWFDDSQMCLDARTKSTDGGATYNIHIIRSNQAIFILKAGDNVHGGQLNQKVYDTIKYLRNVGY
ncbi:profilin-1 [Aquarana catesbeiana]|uniref:profilin-1 n=1 Tax=Aquarana catesbeiana TaxID=8400 RepID=UPI003CC9E1E9